MDEPRRPPAFDRAEAIGRLATEQFDVLVVGGGITGVAVDAATRGLRTALVERGDFASGTSSKSSKLVHGGLRYLQQREVGLVYEGLAERQVALRNAPHLVRVLPFLIPVLTRDGVISRRLARALGGALWMYDLTGGLRIGKRHKRVSSDQAITHMPTLRADRVAGGYLYYDAHTDDARLTLALCRTAAAYGAVVANYAGVSSLRKDEAGRVRGARVQADGDEVEVRADVVVNAAGVWTDDVRALDEPSHPHSIRPAKGIHITVPWTKVRNDIAVVVPVAKDRRSVFVVPWGDLTYVGTTANDRTAALSRRHVVRRSEGGLVTVTGGKLTTYRRMAADTVDEVDAMLGKRRRCRTKRLRLLGADGYEAPPDTNEPSRHVHLAHRYGTEAALVEALVDDDPALGEPLVPGLPYLKAEAVHSVRCEMARTLDDVLTRRTRARLLARDDSAAAADDVAKLIAPELGWDDAERARQVKEYRAAIAAERDAADLPETALDTSGALPK